MKYPCQPQKYSNKTPKIRFQSPFGVILLLFALFPGASPAQERFQVTGAFGPAIALHTIALDKTAFSGLAGLHPDFNLNSDSPALDIKGDLFMTAGIEGFTRLTPHWGFGTSMGFGKYTASGTTDSSQVTVLFTLSQFGLAPEFTLNPVHRMKVVVGIVLGVAPVSLSATTVFPPERWSDIISGTVVRPNYKVTALAPLVQPYLGMDLSLTEFLGLKLVGGYELQNIASGSWKLDSSQPIDDSPAVDFSALFSRLIVYTSF